MENLQKKRRYVGKYIPVWWGKKKKEGGQPEKKLGQEEGLCAWEQTPRVTTAVGDRSPNFRITEGLGREHGSPTMRFINFVP